MTTLSFGAAVKGWSEKAKRNADLVVKDAIQTTALAMSQRQPSVKETDGFYEVGKVPVDQGELINSQQVSLNNSIVATGDVAYAALIYGMELGDMFEAVFTSEHARPIEYGVTGKFLGRYYVLSAVQEWDNTVAASAAKFKDD